MSHFTTISTKIVDTPALIKALGDKGFKDVEVHDVPEHLLGFQGDRRSQTAEVIIRRKYVGSASNDLGFKRQDDGTYQAIISEYDRRRYSQTWLNELSQRYAYYVTTAKLHDQGFELIEQTNEQDGRIHLVARRVN